MGKYTDFWLVKTDKDGNEIWDKTYGGKYHDFVNKVIETTDNGYLMIGTSYSSNENGDIWLVKTDETGIMQWNKSFGGNSTEHGCDIISIEDGYMVAGITGSYVTHDDWDVWIIKTDKEGNELWNKTYGWQDLEGNACIISTENGYLLAGGTLLYGLSDWDGFLIKIDKDGNEIWNETYGRDSVDGFQDIKKTPDGYILVGTTHSFNVGKFDAWLLKVDANGNEIWNKSFGGRGNDHANSVIYDNGSYIIAGDKGKNKDYDRDAWLIKCADYSPPEIKIVRPKENYLYIFDREIMPYDKTMAIGSITMVADSNDSAKIGKVEFYWNGYIYEYAPRAIRYNPLYEWKCRRIGVGAPTEITVAAYYGNAGAAAVDKIEIRTVNLFPIPSASFMPCWRS